MPVTQAQFDADLAAYNTAVVNYIAAVNAAFANPAVVDLSNEDASVQSALAAVTTAQSQIPGQPPTPPPVPPPGP